MGRKADDDITFFVNYKTCIVRIEGRIIVIVIIIGLILELMM